MRQAFNGVAAGVFTAVAALHMLRVVLSWQVQVGAHEIPFWVSWVAMFVAAVLAVWGFSLTGESKRSHERTV